MLEVLSSILVCTRCRGPLTEGHGGHSLRCDGCDVDFRVLDDIPRMSDGAEQRDAKMSAEWAAQSQARAQYTDGISIVNRWELQALPRFIDWLGNIDGPILDVGCGVGHLGASLTALGRTDLQLIGTDFQPELLGEVGPGYVGLIEADVHHLPLRDGVFAGAIASNSLHHFPDPERAMSEIARVLRPGGVFVGYDPRFLAPFELIKKWLRRNDSAFTEDHKAFRIEEYRQLLACSGLEVTDVNCTDPLGILLATGLDYLKAGRWGLAEPLAKAFVTFDRRLENRTGHTPLGLMLAGRALKRGR
jgi:SAM-dependent methyltransferase